MSFLVETLLLFLPVVLSQDFTLTPGLSAKVVISGKFTCPGTSGSGCSYSPEYKRIAGLAPINAPDEHGNIYGFTPTTGEVNPVQELYRMHPDGTADTLGVFRSQSTCTLNSSTEGQLVQRRYALGGYNDRARAVFVVLQTFSSTTRIVNTPNAQLQCQFPGGPPTAVYSPTAPSPELQITSQGEIQLLRID